MPSSIRFGRAAAESYLQRSTNLPPITAFTAMGWVRVAAIAHDSVIFSIGTQLGDAAYQLYAQNTGNKLATFNGAGAIVGSVLTLGVWYHVAMTVSGTSGTNCLAYLNGVLDNSNAASTITPSTVAVGSDAGGGAYLDGNLAAIKLYNRVLTADEITAEMPYAVPVNKGGLNSAYPLGNGWDIAASGLVVPHGVLTRWPDVSGQTGSEWTETGTLDTDIGPPIQFAPSVQRWRARYFVAGAPPAATVVQRRTFGTIGRVGTRRAS